MNDPYATLIDASALRNEAEVQAFDGALAALPEELGLAEVGRLLSVFDDQTQQPEVMFGLIHRIEATPLGVEEGAIVSEIDGLYARAPWWAEVLIMRLLNNNEARATFTGLARETDPRSRETLIRILQSILTQPGAVAGHAQDTLAAIGSAPG